jgi:hypothetical protein
VVEAQEVQRAVHEEVQRVMLERLARLPASRAQVS